MMLTTKAAAAIFAWVFTGINGLAGFAYLMPFLEAKLAPVLTNQRILIEEGDRTRGKMCWTWFWTKRRYAQPVVITWSLAVNHTAMAIPVVAEREQDGFALRVPLTHSPRHGRNDLCVAIPAYLDSARGLSIRGSINYRTSHGLWTVWQDMPEVMVPPL